MVYLDLLFLFNMWIDFFLLLFVKLILKRNVRLYRIIIGSLFGSLTTILVIFNINYIVLTILKIIVSVFMVIISFGYRDIKYLITNFIYLFMISFILGGILILVKNSVSKIQYLLIALLLTPLLIFTFYRQNKKIKMQYTLYHSVTIVISYITISITGFLDSGNKLKDPVTKKNIIIVSKNKLKGINKIRSPMYVPVKTISGSDLIECYKPDMIKIDGKKINNYLIGRCKTNIKMEGIDCLLNNQLIDIL